MWRHFYFISASLNAAHFLRSRKSSRNKCKLMIVIFTNLMHKYFISIHLLHSSTCFEHYYVHLQEDNCIITAYGIVTVFRWLFSTQVTGGLLGMSRIVDSIILLIPTSRSTIRIRIIESIILLIPTSRSTIMIRIIGLIVGLSNR